MFLMLFSGHMQHTGENEINHRVWETTEGSGEANALSCFYFKILHVRHHGDGYDGLEDAQKAGGATDTPLPTL